MIGELKPYADYADSGLDWLGSVPAHWGLLRAKRLFREVDERSATGKEELLSVSHITGVTPRRLKTVTMFMAESNVGHKVCRPGDLVINTLWAWMGALGVTRHTGIVSPAYGVYRPLAEAGMLPAYADYLLRTSLYAAEHQRRSLASTAPGCGSTRSSSCVCQCWCRRSPSKPQSCGFSLGRPEDWSEPSARSAR